MVINKQNAKKYSWGNNCESFELLNTEGLSVKQETMPPGSKEKKHFHNEAKQLFYVLKGEATFYIGDETIKLKQNESVFIEAKQKHLVENSTSETIEFLVISQPSTNEDRVDAE